MVLILTYFWARSSSGRAFPWHGRGDRFESGRVHHLVQRLDDQFSESSGIINDKTSIPNKSQIKTGLILIFVFEYLFDIISFVV